jgi:GWxTD domain-containing protein
MRALGLCGRATGSWAAGVLAAGVVLGAACSGPSRLDSANAGRTVVYDPSVPNFDMEAVATRRDGETGVDLYLGIPRVSLAYLQRGDAYVAVYEVLIRLQDDESRRTVAEEVVVDTVRTGSFDETQSFAPLHRQQRVAVPPGTYRVDVLLTDLHADTYARRLQRVELPGLAAAALLSQIRLEGKAPKAPFAPVVAFHIPADTDSLRAVMQLYGVGAGADVALSMALLRFPHDTTHAAAPSWLMPSYGSLHYRGVVYEDADTLQRTQRLLESVDDDVTVTFSLPPLAEGIYRVAVQARRGGGAGAAIATRERDLAVRHPSFPRVTTLEQMAEAVAYIARPEELERITAAQEEGPAQLKERFDAFWGSLVPNRRQAANLLKLYFSRVEEANLLFTTSKEGWRTDRGMVYIILGPPDYVDSRFDGEVWHYSRGDDTSANTFAFERVRVNPQDEAFDNYVLQRQPEYHTLWTRAVQQWRDGTVL